LIAVRKPAILQHRNSNPSAKFQELIIQAPVKKLSQIDMGRIGEAARHVEPASFASSSGFGRKPASFSAGFIKPRITPERSLMAHN